mmetsp:Transcript_34433/g.83009  ORF Transcript_34433/g.83009 Transcript_34433/m.83009 type:complete len:663 (-) Transcript_34433:80-2068(-)
MSASASPSIWEELYTTFLASVRSVGTACTLAGVGIYLHQRGFVVGNGKRTLALISQQVTIPLLFFTKILYCNQDWSAQPCPNVTESLKDVWVLVVWPAYVCAVGMSIGYGCAKIANVPTKQVSSLLAAVGFGNSTGLPITLLTVIHSNFSASSDLGRIDPTLFLSVYLLLYPVLQWGIGGWLLAPPEKKDDLEKGHHYSQINGGGGGRGSSDFHKKDDSDRIPRSIDAAVTTSNGSGSGMSATMTTALTRSHGQGPALAHNVLNRSDRMSERYQITHRGISEVDASFYMSIQENLNRWGEPVLGRVGSFAASPQNRASSMMSALSDGKDDEEKDGRSNNIYNNNSDEDEETGNRSNDSSVGMDLSGMDISGMDIPEGEDEKDESNRVRSNGDKAEANKFVEKRQTPSILKETKFSNYPVTESSALLPDNNSRNDPKSVVIVTPYSNKQKSADDDDDDDNESSSTASVEHCCETFGKVIQRCLQPPVIGALLGLFIASFPRLRAIFVDIYDRNGDAPLEWFFDGLYTVGQAAVPINMIILGCNLSASYMLNANDAQHRSRFFSPKAALLAVVGKMVIMPIVGFISAYLLSLVYKVPQEIASSFYLVLIVVFLCPTANNVMVMVELSGSGSKEGMARIIAFQYMVAPIVLSLTVTIAVFMATSM